MRKRKKCLWFLNVYFMKIKELGLEELTISEKKETKGGNPWIIGGLIIAGLAYSALSHAPGTNGTVHDGLSGGRGSKGFGMVP